MEIYVTCPFCRKVFDKLAVDTTTVVDIKVDGIKRIAHLDCITIPMQTPDWLKPKANGDAERS